MTPNEYIGAAVRKARGAFSQDAVAAQMRSRGHKKWSQSTVWSVEQGTRPVRAAELVDLAVIIGADITALLPQPSDPQVVFEHFLDNFASSPGAYVSVCGKVWNPSRKTVSAGRCPECLGITESGWAK